MRPLITLPIKAKIKRVGVSNNNKDVYKRQEETVAEAEIEQSEIYLRVVTHMQTRRFLYSTDGENYVESVSYTPLDVYKRQA